MPRTVDATPAAPAPFSLPDALLKALAHGGEVEVEPTPHGYAFRSLRAGTIRVFDFEVARAFLEPMLAKSEHAAPPDGSRWITVHPNGEGSKGVPVLVQEEKKGAGIWHVIGGAGGNLNYLKIRGVKSESQYRQEAADRAGAKKAEKKAAAARDKASGLTADKAEARKALRAQVVVAEREFIQSVATAQGWGPSDLTATAPSGLSPEAKDKADKDHHRALLKKATKAVNLQRHALVLDASLRAAAFGSGVPMEASSDDQVSVSDLSPSKAQLPAGVAADFGGRSKAAGLTPESLKAEVETIKNGGTSPEPDVAALAAEKAAGKAEKAAAIKKELAALAPVPDLAPRVVEAKQALALLTAQKKLTALRRQARAANAEIDASSTEPKAYVLAVTPAEAQKGVADELRTIGARSFLAAVDKAEPDDIAPHVAAGSFAALNAAALGVAGVAALDRSAVDVLGAAGAAQVLARRLRLEFTPEEHQAAVDAITAHHLAHTDAKAKGVLAQVAQLQTAAAVPLPDVIGVDELLVGAETHQKRVQALADANRALGSALGEFEAGAALVAAMGAPMRKNVQVSLGSASLDSAVKQVRALGLVPGDYELAREGGNVFLNVKESGMDKLADSVDRDSLHRVSRNVAIARGDFDEDGFVPLGFANRADLATKVKEGVAESFAQPFAPGADLAASLRSYIGARAADGHPPADILSDIQSAAFFQKVGAGRAAEYRAALDAVAPNKIDGQGLQRAEQLAPAFEKLADAHVASLGGSRSPLHAQTFEPDDVAQEALHRALSAHPTGAIAYKQVGELTPQDQAALRDWFAANVAKDTPEIAGLRADHAKLLEQEPEKESTDMFGEASVNPDWHAWSAAVAHSAGKVRDAGFGWNDYIKAMGGPQRAYAATQDQVRSRVSDAFHGAYNRLNPGAPLAKGRMVIRDNLRHLAAVDPEARAKAAEKQKALIDALRERSGGKYSAGSVVAKVDAAAEQQAAFEQAQMGFFSADDENNASASMPLSADERHTLGHAAEQCLAQMAGTAGAQFKPNKPVKLFHASMSGPDGAVRQRAIKFMAANRRMVAGLGVGTGKTGIGLGAFAHLHGLGEIKPGQKGMFIVPSIVQGQFNAEALRFLKPGAFKWHAEPGASHEERLPAYKDPSTHFSVVTHQSFRDDMLKLGAKHEGGTPDAFASKLAALSRPARAQLMRSVLEKEGIDVGYLMADEGHGLLDREGKEDSRMSTVAQAVTDSTPFYMHASGDPVKNDASEAHSLLQKMDPVRYADRAAFMRKYGGDTQTAREGLQRELARHVYAASLKPDVKVTRTEQAVDLSPAQHEALSKLDGLASRIRLAKMQGKTDAAAARELSPHLFDGAPESMHPELIKQVHDSLALAREAAARNIIDNHPEGSKLDAAVAHAGARKGVPGVVFARSLKAVETLRARLEAAGHRVVTITGKDSSESKAAKIQQFNPDQGPRGADIVLCSDAGAVGANLQSGSWLLQYDTPDTAMVHAQRQGRVDRIGQKNAVELTDLVANHKRERRARARLRDKYDLRDLTTSPLEHLDDTGVAHFLSAASSGVTQASLV